MEDQQYGPWILATELNQMKKTTIEVRGFEENVQRLKAMSNGVAAKLISVREVSLVNSIQTKVQSAVVLPVVTSKSGTAAITDITKPNHAIPDFEVLRDLDGSMNAFSGIPNTNLKLSNHDEENKEGMTLMEVPVLKAKNKMILNDSLVKSGGIEIQKS